MNNAKAYFAFLLTFLLIDALWIGLIAQSLYQQEVGPLLSAAPKMGFALVFYLAYAGGAVVFTINRASNKFNALLLGVFFGCLCYGTYAITNYATLDGWSFKLMIIDIIFGGFVTGISAFVGYLVIARSRK